jgi:hypothetical protein
MKKRIFTVKDKILVKGDENKLNNNEILVEDEGTLLVLKERVNGKIKTISKSSKEALNLQVTTGEPSTSTATNTTYTIDLGNAWSSEYDVLTMNVLDCDVTFTKIAEGKTGSINTAIYCGFYVAFFRLLVEYDDNNTIIRSNLVVSPLA